MSKGIISRTTETVVDENGEIRRESNQTIYRTPIEPEFIKMYIQKLGDLQKLTPNTVVCLVAIVAKSTYNNIVYLLMDDKEEICRDNNLNMHSLNKAIGDLNKTKLLIRLSSGKFLINPNYFAKGSWKDINKIRISIEISELGTSQITVFEKEN